MNSLHRVDEGWRICRRRIGSRNLRHLCLQPCRWLRRRDRQRGKGRSLDQSKKNPSGAVGIMQVIPKYAAASPISIPNVSTADGNIHAGVKMLRSIADTYFNDPKIDPMNKTLMVFASYNAGPNRIAKLRKEASVWVLIRTSGLPMWNWLRPKKSGRRPSPT